MKPLPLLEGDDSVGDPGRGAPNRIPYGPIATDREGRHLYMHSVASPRGPKGLVELRGFEPLASCMPCKRSAN
jgi:hypothetical protein